MARIAIFLLLLGITAAAAASALSSPRASASSFTLRGTVTRVVDGDTIDVRVGARTERVRFIGIDAPEVGECFSAEATAELRRLVLAKRVSLSGDRTQPRRDVYGRLLAYVGLLSGVDVGRTLLQEGYATLYETDPRFARYAAYDAAAAAAQTAGAGLNSACAQPVRPVAPPPPPPPPVAPPPPAPAGNCAPSYPDVCIPPPPPDLDCGQIPYKRFRVVWTVPNPDPHRFDGDHDGVGCES